MLFKSLFICAYLLAKQRIGRSTAPNIMLATDPCISFATSGTKMSMCRIIEHIKKNMAGEDAVLEMVGIETISENMATVTIKTERDF